MNARSFASYAAIMLWCNASETAGEGPGPETPARSASAPPFSFPSTPGKPRRDASATPETHPFSMSREPRVVPPALSTTALSLAFKRSFSSSRRRVSCSSLASLRVDARRSRRAASRSDVIRSRRARDSSSARSRRNGSAARAAASASRDTLSRPRASAATSARARALVRPRVARGEVLWRSRSSRNSTSHVRARSAASAAGAPARGVRGPPARGSAARSRAARRRWRQCCGGGRGAFDGARPPLDERARDPSASRPDVSRSPANDRSASRTPAEESRCAYISEPSEEGLRGDTARARRGHSRPRTGRPSECRRGSKRGSNSARQTLRDTESLTPTMDSRPI